MEFDAESVMITYLLHDNEDKDLIKSAIIEFARIHVERANRSNKLLINGNKSGSHSYISDKLKISIYNDYPITNIK